MLKMISRKIRNVYIRIVLRFFTKKNNIVNKKFNIEDSDIFKKFQKFINNQIEYNVEFMKLDNLELWHKWVGAQYYNGDLYAIPNDETKILKYGFREISYIEDIREGSFKWTGGCIWNGILYAFPRTANSFLKIKNDRCEEVPISIKYDSEHHYSGVCTVDGIVYQPPRNTNHILKTDLKTGISTKIFIIEDKFKIKLRYCGSILHPNGFIYLFPESYNRVIKLDPETDNWCFIGQRISSMCFDAKIGNDGNIYGFTSINNGIFKIDVNSEKVEIIHREITPGAYGTKYGINGCLYSVPGIGKYIYKYDVYNDKVEIIYNVGKTVKAKYAGGVTLPNGIIICVPAEDNSILICRPNKMLKIPEDVFEQFYVDCY